MVADRPAVPLDRNAPLPLYAQLRDVLLREVRDGGLRAGDPFPSEAALQKRFGVSRATIRQAVDELAAAGMVKRVQGLGTFVAAPKIQHVPLLTSFADLATSQGFTPSHRLLSSSLETPPPDVAVELELPEGAPCRFLRRLLLADGDAVGLAETWLPVSALGAHDALLRAERLDRGSLYELLQSDPVALELDHAVETISPGVLGDEDAVLLARAPGAPVLLIRRLTFTPDRRPVESTRLVFAGDRYEYRVELHR